MPQESWKQEVNREKELLTHLRIECLVQLWLFYVII
jgi:hypothetical protein